MYEEYINHEISKLIKFINLIAFFVTLSQSNTINFESFEKLDRQFT